MSKIAVVLGSSSDRDVFESIASILDHFGVSYEKRILSAHRAPDLLRDYVHDAGERGVKVFIGVAGMAAALPGAIASHTTKPVIGVPAGTKSTLGGLDALFSIVQMPPGIPVAAVSVNGGKNAALLALEILGLSDKSLEERMEDYRKSQVEKVVEGDRAFREE